MHLSYTNAIQALPLYGKIAYIFLITTGAIFSPLLPPPTLLFLTRHYNTGIFRWRGQTTHRGPRRIRAQARLSDARWWWWLKPAWVLKINS